MATNSCHLVPEECWERVDILRVYQRYPSNVCPCSLEISQWSLKIALIYDVAVEDPRGGGGVLDPQTS